MLPMLLATTQTPAMAVGTYTYSAALAGKTVGTATITVTDNGVIEIAERASGAMNGQNGSAQDVLTLGGDLAPTVYTGNYSVAGQARHVQVYFTPTAATIDAQSIALGAGAKHFVVLEPGLMSGLFALPAQMQAWNDPTTTAVIPSLGAAFPLTPIAASAGARPDGLPSGDVPLAFGGPAPFTIWYDPTTFVMDELAFPSHSLVVTRVRN